MVKRISLLLDDGLAKKLRKRQARLINKKNDTVSFSQVIITSLEQALKNDR